jgi:hypothetical protein
MGVPGGHPIGRPGPAANSSKKDIGNVATRKLENGGNAQNETAPLQVVDGRRPLAGRL